ncbi:type II toxin-antitoxin system Phd/YefM family antitoxin [Candidatus Palauibacter sp.]|uniref:type II toxin-antitoxin system Phd/YefM family antitoxin n=1 Tax=Candidatus Palauibacter sp. TaxID=3101350 RepID=UPI003C6F73C2
MIRETTYTGARKNLAALMDQVTDTHEPVLIRRRGKEPVALVAAEDLSSWIETAYLLRSPKNAQRLRESMAQDDCGQVEVIDIDELAKRLGLEDG